jgi:L,D-peptidoglycan transpeptidase YkuD (ErfK/YbiS/YcfS/YnhG family)
MRSHSRSLIVVLTVVFFTSSSLLEPVHAFGTSSWRIAAFVRAIGNSSCPNNAVNLTRYPRNTYQVIDVEAPRVAATSTAVSLWLRKGHCFVEQAGSWLGEIGERGLSTHKVEGDGATPTGTYAIGPELYGISANPGVAYPYHRVICGDWWDEAPSSPQYNHFVHIACHTPPPFAGDSEALWKAVPQYDYFAVVEYNASPVVPGRGSAIFIHVSVGTPTAGCLALGTAQLLYLLGWLRPGDHPVVTFRLAES